MNVAFLGLGIMGSRMAAHLVHATHQVRAWNRSPEKTAALQSLGALPAASVTEAVQDAQIVFTMLATPEAVRAVASQILSSLPSGRLWIDCSTVGPEASREMAALAKAKGVRFLDAPVAGSAGPAAAAQLVFQVGGEAADIEEARPLLTAMGSRIVHAGPTGAGSSLKLVNNLLMAQELAAWAETLGLAEALGLPRELVEDAILPSHVAPAYLGSKRAKIDAREWSPEFPLKHALKDIRLALTEADKAGLGLAQATACEKLYAAAQTKGLGDSDIAAVCDVAGKPA